MGMQATKIVDPRGHELAPERRGRGQADGAVQFLAAASRQFLHCFQHLQGNPCALGDGAAFVGDSQITGVVLEQRGAQRLFQPGDLLADRLGCEVRVACGGGKALALHHMGKPQMAKLIALRRGAEKTWQQCADNMEIDFGGGGPARNCCTSIFATYRSVRFGND